MDWPEEIREKCRAAFDSGEDAELLEALKDICFYIGYTVAYDEEQKKKKERHDAANS